MCQWSDWERCREGLPSALLFRKLYKHSTEVSPASTLRSLFSPFHVVKYLSHVPTHYSDIFKREIIFFSKLFLFSFVVWGIFAIHCGVCLSDLLVVTKCFWIVGILFAELAFYLTVQCELSQWKRTVCFYINLQVLYLNHQHASPPQACAPPRVLSAGRHSFGTPRGRKEGTKTLWVHVWSFLVAGYSSGNKGRQLQLRTLHSSPDLFPAHWGIQPRQHIEKQRHYQQRSV